jgi:NAD(P)H-dependent FMN reductase
MLFIFGSMNTMPPYPVLAISGSTRKNSANLQLLKAFAAIAAGRLNVEIYQAIDTLPHFNPDLDVIPAPPAVQTFRDKIQAAAGVVICTPEYVFTLPGSLKNALEWMVSTTIFSGKPVALITASAMGDKAHEALQLVMKTIEARFTAATQLLVRGVKGKVDDGGNITDAATRNAVAGLVSAFAGLIGSNQPNQ